MSQHSKGRYEGRFAAPRRQTARRLGAGTLALLILVLGLARFGAEAVKLLAYADIFIGGGRMLIYGNVQNVDMGDSVNGVPILDEIPEDADGDYIVRLNDGTTIIYKGHTYELNRNLTTILFLGIDHTITETDKIGTGGQSDVIAVIGLDTETGDAKILNISRDTYSEVDVYSINGKFIETRFTQITLAYGYGNGRETSCENAMRTVSRLLFNLPISSYLALDMNGIKEANETVGGVTVKSMGNIQMPDGVVIKSGQEVELHGDYLDRYIRTRTKEVDANVRRMERQRQYMTEFSKKVIYLSKKNLTFPVEVFSTVAPYMVTNLNISDVTFLSSAFLSHGANFSFVGIGGVYDKIEGYSVLYPDETELFEAVLQVFYLQVD